MDATCRRAPSSVPPLALSLVLISFGPTFAQAPVSRPKAIDVAICLDTSSSMDGLIGSAKHRLWDIVNELARVKPTPNLRVAVFSYGNNTYDPQTGWVRLEMPLTTDLDKISERLSKLSTSRTPGSTEYVGRVCRDAVEKLAWSADAGALKIIFVCGNEGAEQDPEVKLKPLAESAVRKGIIINTIFCGSPSDADAAGWKQFADLSEGRFVAIDQQRGTVAMATPMDKDLAVLSAKLNGTFCFAGKDAKLLAENQARQDDNALRLGIPAAASRAESKGGALYRFQAEDLVEKLKQDPKFDVRKVAVDDLPDGLKKLTPDQRDKHVRDLLARREELQKQINDLAKKRAAFIEAETKKNTSAAVKSFDEALREVVREQASKKGFGIQR
jgi:von Willebrand factor type A domain-containing protein